VFIKALRAVPSFQTRQIVNTLGIGLARTNEYLPHIGFFMRIQIVIIAEWLRIVSNRETMRVSFNKTLFSF